VLESGWKVAGNRLAILTDFRLGCGMRESHLPGGTCVVLAPARLFLLRVNPGHSRPED
jgi:hypothetical protein